MKSRFYSACFLLFFLCGNTVMKFSIIVSVSFFLTLAVKAMQYKKEELKENVKDIFGSAIWVGLATALALQLMDTQTPLHEIPLPTAPPVVPMRSLSQNAFRLRTTPFGHKGTE